MAFDDHRHQVVLFGGIFGQDQAGSLNDTWAWDGRGWSQVNSPLSPPPFTNVAMAYDDSAGSLVLLGKGAPQVDAPQTWLFDDNGWHHATPLHEPTPGTGAMAYDPTSKQLILQEVQQTWSWNGSDWSKIAASNEPSNAFYQWTLTVDQRRAVVVGYGPDSFGSGTGQPAWAFSAQSWARQQVGGPDAAHALVGYDDNAGLVIVCSGGQTFAFDASGWHRLNPLTNIPPLAKAGVATDTVHHRMIVFGGLSAEGVAMNTTWAWDGSTWSTA